jgi:anti-sigma factor RsiW
MNDETLTLYYYDDGLTPAERREVEAALASDPSLAARYEALCAELDGLGEPAPAEAPPHLVAQWHDALDRAADREVFAVDSSRKSFHSGSFFWGAAIAASLAIGISIGVFIAGDDPVPDSGMVAAASPADAFSRGLLVHFRDSRDQLSTIEVSTNGNRQQLIQNIIEQNRLFVRMAKDNESQDLARVLRAFEPVLLRLASEDVTPAEAEQLLAQLQFELTIVLTKLTRQVSDKTQATETQDLST